MAKHGDTIEILAGAAPVRNLQMSPAMRAGGAIAGLFVVLCCVKLAHATDTGDEGTTEVRSSASPRWHVDGGLGGSTAGFTFGGLALLRVGPLEVGPGCQFSGFLSTRTGCGMLVGFAADISPSWTVDLLGELGVNRVHQSGGFLNDDPGASGAVGYTGARLGTRWSFGKWQRPLRPNLGLWLFAQRDLSGYEARYSYTETGWLSGKTSVQSARRHLGDEWELGLRVVAGFDLIP